MLLRVSQAGGSQAQLQLLQVEGGRVPILNHHSVKKVLLGVILGLFCLSITAPDEINASQWIFKITKLIDESENHQGNGVLTAWQAFQETNKTISKLYRHKEVKKHTFFFNSKGEFIHKEQMGPRQKQCQLPECRQQCLDSYVYKLFSTFQLSGQPVISL